MDVRVTAFRVETGAAQRTRRSSGSLPWQGRLWWGRAAATWLRPLWVLLLVLVPGLVRGGAGLPPVELLQPSRQGFSDFCLSTSHGFNHNLFVGNQAGVLEYDGQSWRLLQTPGHTQTRSVLALPDGRVVYGGINEFGWFESDSAGNWRARQLSDSLKGRAPRFREVRSIHPLSHGLYFQSKELLTRYQDGLLQRYVPVGEVGGAAALGDTLFVQLSQRGLCRLDPRAIPQGAQQIPDQALIPMLGPDLFAQGNRMICLLPLGKGRLLLGTRFKGLFLLEKGGLRPLPELNARIQSLDLFHGLRLHDGRLALATLQGGVFLLDKDLTIQHILDERAGLPSPMAVHVSQDADGNLWVASTDGVAQLGLEIPYCQFTATTGLPGQPTCMELHEGQFYAGTSRGIFRLTTDAEEPEQHFERPNSRSGICWQLLSTRHGLLAILGGHLTLTGDRLELPILTGQPTLLFQDEHAPDRVWVGVAGGLRSVRWLNGVWTPQETIPGVNGEITSMLQSSADEYWLGTSDAGVWRVRRSGARWDATQLGPAQGLTPGAANVRWLDGHVLVLNGERALVPDAQGGLKPSLDFMPPEGWKVNPQCRFTRTADGTWLGCFQEGLAVAQRVKGRLVWDINRFSSVGRRPLQALPTADGLWVQSEHQLTHFHSMNAVPLGKGLPAVQLRGLRLEGVEWVGTVGGLRQGTVVSGKAPLELQVACAHLGLDGPVNYSFLLEGLDKEWTPWSVSGHRLVEFLPPGDFTLRVRVRGGGHEAREEVLARLHIPKPWHDWIWLRSLALVGLISLILTFTRHRARKLKCMNETLRGEVRERRRVEAALRVSETRYRGLFENALDAICVMDAEHYLESNPAAARLFGLSMEELAGRGPEEFSPPLQPDGRPSQEKARELVSRALQGEQLSFEWMHLRADGQPFLVEVNLSRLDLEGEPGVLAILRDVSDRRLLESQLRQSQKMEAVGRLAGGVAHDFNNILVVILGQCDLLLMSLDSHDPVRDEVQQVRDAAQRAAQLTRQLLIFSRRSTLHPQRVVLNTILGDLEKMLRRVIGEDIRIRLDLAPDLLRVNVDTGQLDQVILNLVVNARDAMPLGGELTIRTRNVIPGALLARETGLPEGQPQVLLSISDTGHGMPADVMAHMFEPFFTTKESGQGTGLGLATVYGIVTQSEGQIRVQSEVGHGTTFHIYLPAILGESLPGREGEVRELAGPRGSERLLLVEDEAAVREVLLRTLRSNGYEVSTACHGREALALLEQGPLPQLILSDVVMPEMGGFDLVRCVRERGLTQPVILMTGYTDRDLSAEQLQNQDVSLLTKPFGPGILLREVRTRLDGVKDGR